MGEVQARGGGVGGLVAYFADRFRYRGTNDTQGIGLYCASENDQKYFTAVLSKLHVRMAPALDDLPTLYVSSA